MAHPRVGRIPRGRPHRGHTGRCLGIALGRDAGYWGLLGLHRRGDSPTIAHRRGAGRRCLGIALGRDAGRRGLLGLHREGDVPAVAHGRGAGHRPGDSPGAGRWPLGPAGAPPREGQARHRPREARWAHRLGIALGRDVGRRGLLGLHRGGDSPAVGHRRGAGTAPPGDSPGAGRWPPGPAGAPPREGQSRRSPQEGRWAPPPGDSPGAGRWPPGPAGAASGTGWADSHSAWNQPPLREILLGLTEAGTASGRSRRGPPKRCPQGAKPGRRGFRRRALSAPCRTGTAPAAAGRWGARRLSPARAGP